MTMNCATAGKQFGKMFQVGALVLFLLPSLAFGQSSRNSIHAAADQVEPLLPGMIAPAFNVRTAKDEVLAFDPSAMARPLIITFYRGGWCPYCNLHLSELRKAEAELKGLGFDLWFISIDRPEILYESLEDPEIGYTVLSDSQLEATRAFGIAFKVDDETVERYKDHGVDLKTVAGADHHVLPAPSTFLVGADGIIRFQYTNPNYRVRLSPEVLSAAARAYLDDADSRLERGLKQKK